MTHKLMVHVPVSGRLTMTLSRRSSVSHIFNWTHNNLKRGHHNDEKYLVGVALVRLATTTIQKR